MVCMRNSLPMFLKSYPEDTWGKSSDSEAIIRIPYSEGPGADHH